MIQPTRQALLILASGAPLALAAGVLHPAGWLAGPIWVSALAVAILADALMTISGRRVAITLAKEQSAAVGRTSTIEFVVTFGASSSPLAFEAALIGDPRLGADDAPVAAKAVDGRALVSFLVKPQRRGDAPLEALMLRWNGPLRLARRVVRRSIAQTLPVRFDIAAVRAQAVRLITREEKMGAKAQIWTGEGSEFQALREFQVGMDARAIDWKQSARHQTLLAKEHRIERNHNIVAAVDCGRSMNELMGDTPRMDQAVEAALLLSLVALRAGDRAGLYAFDSKPRVLSRAAHGPGAFTMLREAAGRIDYSTSETNYTLGLAHLEAELGRRTLVVVFTEFTDPTAAELMVESLARLHRRHVVLFVVLRDAELEQLVSAPPLSADDVSRAVVAYSLSKQRETVLTRLRRQGVHILEAPAAALGVEVVNAYLDLKARAQL